MCLSQYDAVMSSHHSRGAHHHPHSTHHAHGAHETPRHRRLRPAWLALVSLVVLAASCASAWAIADARANARLDTVKSSAWAQTRGQADAGPDTAPPIALSQAIARANQLGAAAGRLPRGSCSEHGPTQVDCSSPVPGVSWAVFEVYPSLSALYHAYETRVRGIRHDPFIQNVGDCGLAAPGRGGDEVAWNRQSRHPRRFTAAAMSAGHVPDTAAAGRVFCVSANGAGEEMAWTQDDGRMLGIVAGSDHEAVWDWWFDVHHNIVFDGSAR